MACCILIFGFIIFMTWPLRKLGLIKPRVSPLAWQPHHIGGSIGDGLSHDMKLSGKKFSITARAQSFRYAFSGLGHVLRHEHNARIHIVAATGVVTAAFHFQISLRDFAWLIFVIMVVFFAEIMNTAFEHLCDVVSPEKNQSVKFAKDIAAGAVLICAIGACLVGLIIFSPYIIGGTSV